MAFVVRRPRGRWEIRESFSTPDGPRARTLASFAVLTPAHLHRAAKASRRRFDPAEIVKAARRAGVPLEKPRADALAESLLREIVRGRAPRSGLARLLRDRIQGTTSERDDVAQWVGSTLQERGTALVDLLGLADRLPKPPKQDLAFPPLSSRRR